MLKMFVVVGLTALHFQQQTNEGIRISPVILPVCIPVLEDGSFGLY